MASIASAAALCSAAALGVNLIFSKTVTGRTSFVCGGFVGFGFFSGR
jgi:hypothetical protein